MTQDDTNDTPWQYRLTGGVYRLTGGVFSPWVGSWVSIHAYFFIFASWAGRFGSPDGAVWGGLGRLLKKADPRNINCKRFYNSVIQRISVFIIS